MAPKLKFSPEAARYISLQRTETQALGSEIQYSKLGKFAKRFCKRIPFSKKAFRYYTANIEPRVRSGRIIADYGEIMEREFATIRDHIGGNLRTVIGIGPGMAGLEIFLSRHCHHIGQPTPLVILVDKTSIDTIKYGFQEVAAAYNSLDMSRENLIINGHPENMIEAVEAENAVNLVKQYEGKVNLVTSLIAWGFHFPVDTYLDLIVRLLKPSGRLIIDVRKGSDGRAQLEAAFDDVSVIHDTLKFERVLATKKAAFHGESY